MKRLLHPSSWPGLLLHAALYIGLWWVLAEGDRTSLWFGVPSVLLALCWTEALREPGASTATVRASPVGILVFAVHFIGESILSGLDVAWRAFRPRMGLDPRFIRYPVRLSSPSARCLFVHSITLMPGTLSAQLDGPTLVIHVLDRHAPFRKDLERLEHLAAYACGDPGPARQQETSP